MIRRYDMERVGERLKGGSDIVGQGEGSMSDSLALSDITGDCLQYRM